MNFFISSPCISYIGYLKTHTLVSASFYRLLLVDRLVTPASAKDISSSTCVVVVSLKKERDRELKPANERSMCISSPRCLISAFNIMYISSYDLTAQYMP